MTGPGLVTIPLLFQNAGWLLSIIVFVVVTLLSGTAALLLCEALSKVPGNEKFQRKIEFSYLSEILVANRTKRWIIQIVLFISIQSVNIAAIILSSQSMDSLLLSLAGHTCGVGIYPRYGIFCVNSHGPQNSPFGNDFMLVTAGFLITLAMVVPLGLMDLVDNVRVQIDLVPLIGKDQSQLIGTVLFNYAFIITVPSWVNDLRPDVSIRKSIWYSTLISTLAYVILGIFGGMSFQMNINSNIIAAINESNERSVVSITTTYLFHFAVLITSIPVFTIVVRYNLLRGGYCGKGTATFLSTVLPWIIVIPFQTGSWLNALMNWSSLIFTSSSNFLLPFYLFYLSQTSLELKEKSEDIKSQSDKLETSCSPISPRSRSPSVNSARSIGSWFSLQKLFQSPAQNYDDEDADDNIAILSDVEDLGIDEDNNDSELEPEPLFNDEEKKHSIKTLSPASPGLPKFPTSRLKDNDSKSINDVPINLNEKMQSNHRRTGSAPDSLSDSEKKISNRPKLQLDIPRKLTQRTSSNRRQLSPVEHTVPIDQAPIPIITLNDGDGLTVVVDLASSHKSEITIEGITDEKPIFKAFPISGRKSLFCAIICASISVLLVGGVVLYDFVELGLGKNVFNPSDSL
ncbi:hypothetical protein G9A89_011207 [Geosiphon pyriformis]|nr:hypothetical protein G9A89_011207 [Geosiphon pyriformis]